jgi:hypothetical protein
MYKCQKRPTREKKRPTILGTPEVRTSVKRDLLCCASVKRDLLYTCQKRLRNRSVQVPKDTCLRLRIFCICAWPKKKKPVFGRGSFLSALGRPHLALEIQILTARSLSPRISLVQTRIEAPLGGWRYGQPQARVMLSPTTAARPNGCCPPWLLQQVS